MSYKATYPQALASLAPGAQWQMTDSDLSTLMWFDDVQQRPDDKRINAEVARLTALGAPVPQSVPRLQALLALNATGLLAAAKDWVATQDMETQIAWDNAGTFQRGSALIARAAVALGWTNDDIDRLFIAAAQINP